MSFSFQEKGIERLLRSKNHYRSLLVLLTLIIMVAFSPTSAFGSSLPNTRLDVGSIDGILIQSVSTRYDPESGSFHLFGEIVNDRDDWSAANIMINATFYGSFAEDQTIIIGNMSGSPYFDFLNPSEKSGFELMAYGQVSGELANFSYYSISLTWDKVQEQKPGLLKLQLRNASLDPCGNYHITGTVTNYDKHKTKNVIVSAAFYNNRNQIVATSYAKLGEERILAPTKSDSFTFLIEKSVLPHFAYYSLNVQNANYSSFSSDNLETRNSDSSLSSDYDMNIPNITVFSNSTIYHVGTNAIEISGRVYYPFSQHNGNIHANTEAAADSPRVLIKIMTPTFNTLERITAPLYPNGTFSTTINFVSLAGSEGQVYKIRAEYDKGIGENTFAIGYGVSEYDLKNGGSVDNSVIPTPGQFSELCKKHTISPLTIVQLDWKPISTVDASTITRPDNDSDGNSEISYPSHHRGEINIGSSVMLTAIAKNESSKPHTMVMVFEIFDSSGTIVFLHLDNHTLDPGPNSTHETNISWFPSEAGVFTVKTFAIGGSDQPRVLSPPVQMTLNVSQD